LHKARAAALADFATEPKAGEPAGEALAGVSEA
jgi:hypothetical protein